MDITVKDVHAQSKIKSCAVGSVVLWTTNDGLDTRTLLITTQKRADEDYKVCWDLDNSMFIYVPKDAYVTRCDAKLEVIPQEEQYE